MTIDMNPRTQGMVHPEQKPEEYFLGNFDTVFAENKIPWKTKRIGNVAFQENGKPYPTQIRSDYRPMPVFVLRSEFLAHYYKMLYSNDCLRAVA